MLLIQMQPYLLGWRDDIPFFIALIGGLYAVNRVLFKYLEEKSLGRKAVGDLREKVKIMSDDFEKLKSQVGYLTEEKTELKKTIQKLEDDFDEVIRSALKYYNNR